MKQRYHRHRITRKILINPLSNWDILDIVVKMKIPHFRGVFMRDTLLNIAGPSLNECWILNQESIRSVEGSHWVALAKCHNTAYYFDSFGNLPPPLEIIEYLKGVNIYYNIKRYQSYGSNICGHLCLKFLSDFWQSVSI